VFCEGVQHCLQFCLNQLNCVKIAFFQFYLQSRKQRNVQWVGNNSCVVFGKKIQWSKKELWDCVLL
jgi:hypothetical protein